jgi:intein/homing endonuclease
MWIYLTCAGLFVLQRMAFFIIANIFKRKQWLKNNSYVVLLPTKNQPKEILIKSLDMLISQKGDKQILVGDDGSTIPISTWLPKRILNKITLLRSEGIGKKEMQIQLIALAKYDIAVQMDDDIILDGKYALKKLCGYFNTRNKIGVINPRIKVITKRNLVEKLQEFQYACANDIGRSGMGRFGINPCATGEVMAFRLDVLKKHLDEYRNTEHMGAKMNFGEDRFITNIFLREGYSSIVAEDVLCYTYPKETFKVLMKQQCLPPQEKIVVRKNGKVQVLPIASLLSDAKDGWNKIGGYEALSFNKETLDYEWKSITGFYKTFLNGRTKEIFFNNGRRITTTCDHPFLCPTYDGFYVKRAGRLSEEDFVPLLNGSIEPSGDVEISGYKIDEDMAYFIGLYLGDGNLDYQSVRLFFGLGEEDFALDAKRILVEKFNAQNTTITKDLKNNVFIVRCYSIAFQDIFKNLGISGLQDVRAIPDYFYACSDIVKMRLIEGLLNSDGHIRSRENGMEITYSSISKDIAEPLCLLLDMLGICNTLRREKSGWLKDPNAIPRYIVSISDQESIKRLLLKCKYFTADSGYRSDKGQNIFRVIPTKIMDLCRLISTKYSPCKFAKHGYVSHRQAKLVTNQKFVVKLCDKSFCFARPTEIKEHRYINNVYDIEVEGNHNFLHASGVFVNNCRWKRSGIRESLRCMREVKNPYLKVWSLFNFVLPMLFFIVLIALVIIDLLRQDYWGLLYLLSSVITIALLMDIPLLLKKPKLLHLVLPFTLYNLFCLIPLWFVSVFSQTETKWGTR